MNRELAMKVANAVLYEGYMLYPYRASAIKNRQRWSFGILYPPAYDEVRSGTERWHMHSECLLKIAGEAALHVHLRFLHLVTLAVAKKNVEGFETVASLAVDGKLIESLDEGVEKSIEFDVSLNETGVRSSPPLAGPGQFDVRAGSQTAPPWPREGQNRAPELCVFPFSFPGSSETEALHDADGHIVGEIRRRQREVTGTVSVSAARLGGNDNVVKLTIEISNTSSLAGDAADRDSALLTSLLSAHTILSVTGGEFVSLLDPPQELVEAVSKCQNIGNFPVLVGAGDERDMMLCSPIVLYDYPQIAPESAGDFFDGTEMDEMLTLRVMTLTDDEKAEMRLGDDRIRNLLQRTEETAREQLMKTHGTIRSMRPVSERH